MEQHDYINHKSILFYGKQRDTITLASFSLAKKFLCKVNTSSKIKQVQICQFDQIKYLKKLHLLQKSSKFKTYLKATQCYNKVLYNRKNIKRNKKINKQNWQSKTEKQSNKNRTNHKNKTHTLKKPYTSQATP